MGGPDLSGEVLDDRYRILERIAEGAMGVVYRGNRMSLDRAVAIKVMHTALPEAMEGRKRFEREAQVMAKLEHPHCVSIIDYGLHGAKPYVVMELVRGQSLADALDDGPFEIARAVDVMRQVLSGLAHAHEQGIIHRDIKPANIMITPKAPLGLHVRILDFGLARLMEQSASLSNGAAVGTPSYMAPEQCRGEALDARTDIYACGVVLFEMLAGRKPFVARDPYAIVKKQLEQQPPRLAEVAPGNYGELEKVVARALAKAPADRYPSAVAMAEALEAALGGRATHEPTTVLPVAGKEPTADVPITVGSSVVEPARDNKAGVDSSIRRMLPTSRTWWWIVGALVLAVGAVVAVIALAGFFGGDDAEEPRDDGTTVVADRPVVAEPQAPADPVAALLAQGGELASSGKTQAAIDLLTRARGLYPQHAQLALALGKLYFAKMWWNDGLLHLRDAIKLDPALKTDAELTKLALRAYLTPPRHDERLARFVVELGPAMKPLLDETARTHPKPDARSRAATLARRIK